MEINKQRNGQYTMRFIFSPPFEKGFIYNGDKQTLKWADHNEVYIQSSIGETFYKKVYMEISNGNKQRNWQFTTRFIFSLPLEKRFISNGDKQTEEWSDHNEVYIQSSIGETFYI